MASAGSPALCRKERQRGLDPTLKRKVEVTLEKQNAHRLGGFGMAVCRVKHLGRPCVYAVCLQVLWEEWSIKIIALRE